MKILSELNIMQSHDEFEFMLIPTCNDYYIDNCDFLSHFDNFNI